MSKIKLSKAIENLREELAAATQAGKGADIRFDVGEVQLEIELEAETTGGANAEVNWWVLTGSLNAGKASTARHKLTISMSPVDAAGKPLKVSQKGSSRARSSQTEGDDGGNQ